MRIEYQYVSECLERSRREDERVTSEDDLLQCVKMISAPSLVHSHAASIFANCGLVSS